MRSNDSIDSGPAVDARQLLGGCGFLAVILFAGWAEVRFVWWAIDSIASLCS